MTLNIDDLGTVWEALFVARSRAHNIGLKLKVPVGTLDSIMKQYSDPSDQLRETLKVWLKMATQQKWENIIKALRSPTIGEAKLASDIEAEYCQGTPGQASQQAVLSSRDTQIKPHEKVAPKRDKIISFLASNVSPGGLADKLLVAGLINDEVRQKALVTSVPVPSRIRPMIDAVISRIELNATNYDKFISVLKMFGALDDLIRFIEN